MLPAKAPTEGDAMSSESITYQEMEHPHWPLEIIHINYNQDGVAIWYLGTYRASHESIEFLETVVPWHVTVTFQDGSSVIINVVNLGQMGEVLMFVRDFMFSNGPITRIEIV